MYCLETKDLTYQFSREELVLNNINLQVGEGNIYGFLGPNGAGKTTTLRLMLGLLRMQRGFITVFGETFEQHRISILRRIGSLIESPSLYGHLTAVENLSLLREVYQCPRQRIQEVLDLVGLPNTGSKKASQFSLGMKQRLSIAIALLHNPSLLILDEPTNGLDPNSIIEVRELLKNLNQQRGTTILISSHLLSEIERMVTHVGIINKGRMIFQGTLETLKDKRKKFSTISLATSDNEKASIILAANHVASNLENGKIILPIISNEVIARINQQLAQDGVDVYEISINKSDLETIFMDLINS